MDIKNALTVLNRLAGRNPRQAGRLEQALRSRLETLAEIVLEVATETGDPIGQILSVLLNQEEDLYVVYSVAKKLEQVHGGSIPLREVAAITRGRVLRGLHSAWATPNQEQQIKLIGWANNYASALIDLNRWEEALEILDTAITLGQSTSDNLPTLEIAMSYLNKSFALSALERRDDALRSARECSSLFQLLYENHPERSRIYWAQALTNLGNCLGKVALTEEALQAAAEATSLYREQIKSDSGSNHLADLAMGLVNLGNRLGELNRWPEALSATNEAAQVYERLAEARPDIYQPHLAKCLSNLATRYHELGSLNEAYQASLRSISLYRKLSQRNPELFLPDLAKSLNTLGNRLAEKENTQQALEVTRESVKIYRELSQTRPDACRPDLAMSLHNLAARLITLNLFQEALEAEREAVDLYLILMRTLPKNFMPGVAFSLNQMAIIYMNLGSHEGSLEAALTATALYRRIAQDQPERFGLDLARSLTNLAIMCGFSASATSASHLLETAVSVSREGVDLFRKLVHRAPSSLLPQFANSLEIYANRLVEAGRPADSLEAYAEALCTLYPFIADYPEIYHGRIHTMAQNYLAAARSAGMSPDPGLTSILTKIGIEV